MGLREIGIYGNCPGHLCNSIVQQNFPAEYFSKLEVRAVVTHVELDGHLKLLHRLFSVPPCPPCP